MCPINYLGCKVGTGITWGGLTCDRLVYFLLLLVVEIACVSHFTPGKPEISRPEEWLHLLSWFLSLLVLHLYRNKVIFGYWIDWLVTHYDTYKLMTSSENCNLKNIIFLYQYLLLIIIFHKIFIVFYILLSHVATLTCCSSECDNSPYIMLHIVQLKIGHKLHQFSDIQRNHLNKHLPMVFLYLKGKYN